MTQPFGPDTFVGKDRQALYRVNDSESWSSEKIGERSRTQLVFDHPPRDGHPPVEETRQASLRIVRRLSSHKYDEAQLLLCSVLQPPKIAGPFIRIPPEGTLVVAKVFDPLFYTTVRDFSGGKIDTVAEADCEIAHEGTAYARLSEYADRAAHPESTIIPDFQPKFYGFWHFIAKSQDPRSADRTRSVRLLLLEYVDGLSISEMCGFKDNDTLVPLDARGQQITDPDIIKHCDVDNTNADIAADKLSHWQRRMFIIDAVVDGLARQKHMGVDLLHACQIRPDQIIVESGFDAVATAQPYKPDLTGLRKPRIVVVNYTLAITSEATAQGSLIWQKLLHPCSPVN